MTSSPDTVSRRGRAANGGFRRWTVALGTAIRILGSFRLDVDFWAVLLLLCILLLPAVVHPSFAASNAMLVLIVGSVACLVGSRVGYLAAWPGGILVPRYNGTLFVLCVAAVVLATLLAGFVCWSLGNSAPALAPAMFVGAAMVHQAIRLPHLVGGIWFLILVVCQRVRREFRRRTPASCGRCRVPALSRLDTAPGPDRCGFDRSAHIPRIGPGDDCRRPGCLVSERTRELSA